MHRRQLVARLPRRHHSFSQSLRNLADAVLTRFKQLRQIEDLEEAIIFHRQALAFCPVQNPDYPISLRNLADAVLTRFEQSHQIEDLEEAILLYRQVLSLLPLGHSERFVSLDNVSSALIDRFERSGSTEDLDEVITYHRLQNNERDPQEQEQRERHWEPGREGRREGEKESERNRDSYGEGTEESTGLDDNLARLVVEREKLQLESANLEKRLRRLEREIENVASSDLSPGFFHNSKDIVVNDGVFNDVQGNQMNTNSGA